MYTRICCSLLFFSQVLFAAGQPLISITLSPDSPFSPDRSLPYDGGVVVQYIVTNQTSRALSFRMRNISGITVFRPNSSACLAEHTLLPHASCTLNLLATARDFSFRRADNGPILDTALASGSSVGENNVFWAYIPPVRERLNLRSTGTGTDATLTSSVQGLALSVNNTALNAALTGNPRQITITNTGTKPAIDVKYVLSHTLPSGTTISPTSCGTISANGGTCTLTVTPSTTDTTAFSGRLVFYSVASESFLVLNLDILSYGSIYQTGHVFAIDDDLTTYPATGSVGGKIAARDNQALPWPLGIAWSLDLTHLTNLISESSSTACLPLSEDNGSYNGKRNTEIIVAAFEPVHPFQYAASLCYNLTDGGYSDWYLPAICELGYYRSAPETPTLPNPGCGTESAPCIQNMLSNLYELQYGTLEGIFWSSTQYSDTADTSSWSQYYLLKPFTYQTHDGKTDTSGVRCVRALTQPTA